LKKKDLKNYEERAERGRYPLVRISEMGGAKKEKGGPIDKNNWGGPSSHIDYKRLREASEEERGGDRTRKKQHEEKATRNNKIPYSPLPLPKTHRKDEGKGEENGDKTRAEPARERRFGTFSQKAKMEKETEIERRR